MQTKRFLPMILLLALLFMPFADTAQEVSARASAPVIIPQEGAGTEVSTGADPEPGGDSPHIQSLSGSYVNFDPSVGGNTSYIPGVSQTLCFRSETFTTDWEYVYSNWLKFPDTWNVSNVYVEGTPVCDSGASWDTFAWSYQTSPYEVRIDHPRYQANTDHCTAYYCVEVTPQAATDPAPVSWYFDGDGWGGAPHNPCSSDGYTPAGQSTCDEALSDPAYVPFGGEGLFFAPNEITTSGCQGEQQTHEVHLANFTGSETTVSLMYYTEFGSRFIGPNSLTIPDATVASFSVSLHPHVCAENGELTSRIEATNGTDTATMTIHKEVYSGQKEWQQLATNPILGMDNVLAAHAGKVWQITGYGVTGVSNYDPATDSWTVVPSSAPPFGQNYARSGCQYGNKVFMYGDTTTAGFTGLWSYNMETNVWTAETPAGEPPSLTGIWAPAWVSDPETHLCYLTGGANTPGTGTLNTVFVYDPLTNAWLPPLPPFTTPRDFHAAFVFEREVAKVLQKLLCVAGGNYAVAGLASTQCYDFTAGTWSPENFDIGPLPGALWGMGYATLEADEGSDLWFVQGVGETALLDESWRFNTFTGLWEDLGTVPPAPTYRLSAVALDNTLYAVGGSTSGFNFSGYLRRYFEETCEACVVPDIVKDGPPLALPGERITYTITIPQLPTDFVYVTDALPEGLSYVPGSLTVTPDIGYYDYIAATRMIYWSLIPVPLKADQWKPASAVGPSAESGLSLTGDSGPQSSTARPAAQTNADLLWGQPLSSVDTYAWINQDFPDLSIASSFLADDFTADSTWIIETFFIPGNGFNGFSTLLNASQLTFMIYADNMGVPAGDPSGRGDLPLWAVSLPPTDPQLTITTGSGGFPSNVQLDLDTPLILPAGHYWFIFYPTMNFGVGGQYGRQPADTSNGYTAQFINPGGAWGFGTEWQPWTVIGPTQTDLAFSIYGTASQSVTISFQADVDWPRGQLFNFAMLWYGDAYNDDYAETFTGTGVFLPITIK